jgi:uncharacterized repeat protein (TIGR03803 family)
LAEEAALDRAAVATDRVWCRELRRFLLPALIAGLGLIAAGRATAQTFTTLHSFTALSAPSYQGGTNSDGAGPYAGLITDSSGTTLYGTAQYGGSSGHGTVFAVNTDGSGFTNLYSFTATSGLASTNSDGALPVAGLILSGNTLFGAAHSGGSPGGGSTGDGTLFAVNTDGTGFTNLHSFHNFAGTPSDGGQPNGLILSGDTLYGTAAIGGDSGYGTVFKFNTNGTGFTILHDGGNPQAGVILDGNTLYGTGNSTVFAVNTDGTGFTNLHTFTYSDGDRLQAGLVLSGNTLYGTAYVGGGGGEGTVFAVKTDGAGFTNLYSFTASSTNSSGVYTNRDGRNPYGGLMLLGHTLYGTTESGGSLGFGTMFAVNTDGSGFTTLHTFTGGSDGAYPRAGLMLSGSTLYGTTGGGGTSGNGTVFSLALLWPQLAMTISGPYVILTWPANDPAVFSSGFRVQATLDPLPFTPATVWNNFAVPPTVINGYYSITVLDGTYQSRRLYRLRTF